ncbi:hypothetical protein GCM10025867_29630 [Frondihabitans sucicola]|uniref:ABC-2 type transporter domain-containing protein n=1 Tax=Frondihabitans sucicola TaxID=1268041 RepID=A0ABM8GQM6_9MICO|nr:hypothetical protein GCM10025867_29630 [Frondihabitans sucicola]
MSTATIAAGSTRRLKNHVTLGQTIRHSFTMAYRGLLKVRRTPEQLIDVTIQPILFTLMFTYLFGGAIAGSVSSYLPVIIPGILVQTVITGSVTTGVQLREDMDKGCSTDSSRCRSHGSHRLPAHSSPTRSATPSRPRSPW